MPPRVFWLKSGEIVIYALVRLNAQKTRFKSRTAKPVFGHLLKKTKKPFFTESIYRRFVSGDMTEYGVNVAKISKVHFDKITTITTLLPKKPHKLLHILDHDVRLLIR
jgi:hypothetical protein